MASQEKSRGNKQNKTQQTDKPTQPEGKQKTSPAQLLILILLILVIFILSFLVFLFFQPDKFQIWQTNRIPLDENSTELPEVKRLIPEQEQILEITKLPEPPQETINPEEKVPEPEKADTRTRDARLFYVKVNMEGQISLKSINRPVTYASSPLTRTINSLLDGPSSDEINKGSLTLIPEGTRLLSARVDGGTAYLNFNESFRFNSLGREGYSAQLKQIVYTATEFSNIDSVQILIEGSVKDYLGGEGIYVGEPLSRETFQTVP